MASEQTGTGSFTRHPTHIATWTSLCDSRRADEEDFDDNFLIDLLDFTASDEEQGKPQHEHNSPATFAASESPEVSMMNISSSQFRTSEGTIELFSDHPLQMPQQFTPMDREARVLRYREKRKTRKFQKIIRYASRKAYAETRPRIKGRFAKRTDVELAVDQMFVAPVMVESGYGVVHSY